ncbi:hypothetical protein LAZ67_X001479 [Cordylochernes scorpioides]|uniref:Uncharacterized protein n=1 Tax=Cordylochernes scorpioides TaxID=51811 RepID=A0ABY6LSG7_9ARAC|nr:hypothetical protein LAZ67_X001479 [Cordylochernes scorpioides]
MSLVKKATIPEEEEGAPSTRIVFTDEKLFTFEQVHNHQNDRSWHAEAPDMSVLVEHRQNTQSVMAWAGICVSCKTPLIFMDQGVKINQVSCRNILMVIVLLWAQIHLGNADWTFQQGLFSGLHHVGGMVALLTQSQPHGLLNCRPGPVLTGHKSLKSLNTRGKAMIIMIKTMSHDIIWVSKNILSDAEHSLNKAMKNLQKAMIIMQFDFSLTNVPEPI